MGVIYAIDEPRLFKEVSSCLVCYFTDGVDYLSGPRTPRIAFNVEEARKRYAPCTVESILNILSVWTQKEGVKTCSAICGYGPFTDEQLSPPDAWRLFAPRSAVDIPYEKNDENSWIDHIVKSRIRLPPLIPVDAFDETTNTPIEFPLPPKMLRGLQHMPWISPGAALVMIPRGLKRSEVTALMGDIAEVRAEWERYKAPVSMFNFFAWIIQYLPAPHIIALTVFILETMYAFDSDLFAWFDLIMGCASEWVREPYRAPRYWISIEALRSLATPGIIDATRTCFDRNDYDMEQDPLLVDRVFNNARERMHAFERPKDKPFPVYDYKRKAYRRTIMYKPKNKKSFTPSET
jgi:hypothetical protein